MSNRKSKAWPKIIKRGNATVRIYRVARQKKKSGPVYTEFKLAYYSTDGHRRFESFNDLINAEAKAHDLVAAMTRSDAKAITLTSDQRDEYLRSSAAVDAIGVKLDVATAQYVEAFKILGGQLHVDAARHYHKTHSEFTSQPVSKVVSELIELRTKRTFKGQPASAAYLRDLNTRLVPFGEKFGVDIHKVKASEIEAYVDGEGFKGRTRHNTLKVLRTLFHFAKSRKYLPRDANPFEGIEMNFQDEGEVGIFTPDELRRLVAAAKDHYPDLLPFLVIGAFAGLRSAEIARLEWAKIGAEYIEVSAAKAKTRSRRLVPIQPNLSAWLETFKRDDGTVVSIDAINHGFRLLTAATKTAALPAVVWKNNGLRHSFITYRYEVTKDEGKVASEAGNSPTMIHKHYRQLATSAVAKEWFEVKP